MNQTQAAFEACRYAAVNCKDYSGMHENHCWPLSNGQVLTTKCPAWQRAYDYLVSRPEPVIVK